jgi:hypothetical protein
MIAVFMQGGIYNKTAFQEEGRSPFFFCGVVDMKNLDCRYLGCFGPRGALMVVNSVAVVRDAMRDGVPLEDLIEDRCRDCNVSIFFTTADLVDFHGAGGEWPAETICPTCHRAREAEDERQHAAERELLKTVIRAAGAQATIADPVDREVVGLPGAVAELRYRCQAFPRLLAIAAKIAKSWGTDLNTLLSCAATDADSTGP